MEINIQGIKNQILKAYQYAAEKAGILAGHSVKVFKQGHAIAQRDARVAAAVVCVSNVLFFEITFGVATLSDYALSKVFGADSELTARSIWAKRFVLLTIVISAVCRDECGLGQRAPVETEHDSICRHQHRKLLQLFSFALMESEKPTARAGRRGSGGNVKIDLAALPVQIQIAGEQISSQLVEIV